MRVFRKLLSIYVFSYFPFGFEDRIWDLIVSIPDHCLSFYFTANVLGVCSFCSFVESKSPGGNFPDFWKGCETEAFKT